MPVVVAPSVCQKMHQQAYVFLILIFFVELIKNYFLKDFYKVLKDAKNHLAKVDETAILLNFFSW
jgi:hypothetical protein